ncbi:hypothetical protein, partial [Yersinia sp. IP36721]|uniref:hypothetical protein n=1 Tax=Yersinia sp. IP36721 TaxID=2161716 RepID=UPI001968C5A3
RPHAKSVGFLLWKKDRREADKSHCRPRTEPPAIAGGFLRLRAWEPPGMPGVEGVYGDFHSIRGGLSGKLRRR